MGKDALSRESHQHLISAESAPPTKKARAFSQYEVVTGDLGWSDGKNLGTLDISIREAPGPPTLSIMVIYVFTYKYKHKSSFLQNHYPFVSFSFHATSRLPSAPHIPRSWKS